MLEFVSDDDSSQMDDWTLHRSRRNELMEAIQKAELQPADFQWKTVKGQYSVGYKVSALIHKPTNSHFLFDGAISSASGEPDFYCIFRPGQTGCFEKRLVNTWHAQRRLAEKWLEIVKREHDAPDLWAAIAAPASVMEQTEGLENTQFSTDEQTRISQQLDEIRHYIVSVAVLQEEQSEHIARQFDYLREATGRLGRRDWIGLAIGLIFQIMFTDPSVTKRAQDIFGFALQRLAQAINFTIEGFQQFLPGP